MRLFSALAVAATVSLGCRTAPPPPPASPSSIAPAAVELAAFIPADTPYAFFLERGLLDHPFAASINQKSFVALGDALVEAAEAEAALPIDRFWRQLALAFGRLDETSLRAAGWRPGQSELALYGYGAIPVLRARADGPRLRALVLDAARRAGVALDEQVWQGRSYLRLEVDVALYLVMATSPDQVAIAAVRDAAAVAEHLTSFTAPEGGTLAGVWPVGDHDRVMWIDPDRMAPLIADPAAMGLFYDPGKTPPAACLSSSARFVRELPRTSATVDWDARHLGFSLEVELSKATADMFRSGAVPRWPDDDPSVPTFRLAMAFSPLPLLHRAAAMYRRLSEAAAACDKPMESEPFSAMLGPLAPLGMVQGAAIEMIAPDHDVTMTLALGVRDVPALWSFLSRAVPTLGATVPAIGEVRELPGLGLAVKIGVGKGALVGAAGVDADRRIRKLVGSSERARTPISSRIDHRLMKEFRAGTLRFLGQPMVDDDPDGSELPGNATINSRLDGNRLVIRTVIDKNL